MNIDLTRIGAVTRNLGSPGFGQALLRLFAGALDVRLCSVFTFASSGEPRVIVSEGATPVDRELARRLAAKYAKHGFREDPNIAGHDMSRAPEVYQTRAQDRADTRYRGHSFEEPRIGYQLVQLSCLGGVLYRLCLSRDERMGCFDSKDVATIRALSRFAIPAVHRHIDLDTQISLSRRAESACAPHPVATLNTATMHAHVRQAFLQAPHCLSPREAEVCAGIVLGYSTTTIGFNLRIASNTVTIHRRRAYKKLGIRTQNELSARYFENLEDRYAAS